MSVAPIQWPAIASPYAGLRMTADEFFKIPDDGLWYELIDGVVCVSPSPTPIHQRVVLEVGRQLANHLDRHRVGMAFVETDVHIGNLGARRDVVYRPEIVYIATENPTKTPKRLIGPPDVVVEVVSPSSRLVDRHTKKDDYERFGVREYWLVDPDEDLFLFYRRKASKLIRVRLSNGRFRSTAIAGFTLDLKRIRTLWKERSA